MCWGPAAFWASHILSTQALWLPWGPIVSETPCFGKAEQICCIYLISQGYWMKSLGEGASLENARETCWFPRFVHIICYHSGITAQTNGLNVSSSGENYRKSCTKQHMSHISVWFPANPISPPISDHTQSPFSLAPKTTSDQVLTLLHWKTLKRVLVAKDPDFTRHRG